MRRTIVSQTIASPVPSVAPLTPAPTLSAKRSWRPLGWLAAGWRFVIGVVLCQTAITSLLVVGWTGRIMRRRVLREWWRKSPHRTKGSSFEDFAAGDPDLASAAAIPRWLVAEEQDSGATSPRRGLHRWFISLFDNARRGASGALNVLVWTLPGTALLYLAWVLGWTISFNKVYEQSHIGGPLGLLAIALFALAMLYVPIALARQATTGSAAAFYDWRFNWRLVRHSAWRQLQLAIVFWVLAAPLLIVRMAPYFVGQAPEFAEMTGAQITAWLNGYYFWASFLLLPLFIVVWRRAAATYARAVLALLRHNPATKGWRDGEKRALTALGYQFASSNAQPIGRNSFSWLAGGLSTCSGLVLTWMVWSTFAIEVMVAQFFHYIPAAGWLNPPLVLLPWIRYLPPGLVE
jgi:hypothetical protein